MRGQSLTISHYVHPCLFLSILDLVPLQIKGDTPCHKLAGATLQGIDMSKHYRVMT